MKSYSVESGLITASGGRANQIIDLFDHAPMVEATIAPTNEPLTIDELRQMDGEPVWIERIGCRIPYNSNYASNLARYVFSRAQLEDDRVNDDLDSAVAEAMRIMAENGDTSAAGTGNMLDEILVYAFLEEKLKAPKLMSRMELHTELARFRSREAGIIRHGLWYLSWVSMRLEP